MAAPTVMPLPITPTLRYNPPAILLTPLGLIDRAALASLQESRTYMI